MPQCLLVLIYFCMYRQLSDWQNYLGDNGDVKFCSV